jgi:hypothetical protein
LALTTLSGAFDGTLLSFKIDSSWLLRVHTILLVMPGLRLLFDGRHPARSPGHSDS